MALVELDLRTRGSGKPVRLADLAARRGIPEQYLEQLFASLRRAGLVTGRRGVGGGFTFARRPGRVTVLDVVTVLDGVVGPVHLEATRPEDLAGAGAVWRAAGDAYENVLSRTTVSELADRELQLGESVAYEI
jgi:Rrf2 family protein